MATASINLNWSRIRRAVETAAVRTANNYGPVVDAAMSSPVWPWPNRTVRSSGQIVTSPRDVVDTGALRDSRQPAKFHTNSSGVTIEIDWTAAHAVEVFTVGVNAGGPRNVPYSNLANYQFALNFAKELQSLL